MEKKTFRFLIAAVLVLTFALLSFSIAFRNANKQDRLPLEKVEIVGTYHFGQEEITLDLTDGIFLDEEKHESIYISGRFTKPIPINYLVMLRVDNITAEIYLNEELLYAYGEYNGFNLNDKAGGNVWTYFVSPGIEPEDKVEIRLHNPYGPQGIYPFTKLISTLYMGYDLELFRLQLSNNAPRLFFAMLIVCLGLVLLVACIILFYMKAKNIGRYFYLSGFTIASGVWFFIRFDIMSFFSPYPLVNNDLDAIALWLTGLFALTYLSSFVHGKSRRLLVITEYAYSSLCLLVFAGTLLRVHDPYTHRSQHIIVLGGMSALTIACVIYESVWKKNKEMRSILLSVLMLCGGCITDAVNYYQFHNPTNIIFNICFLIFITMEYIKMVRYYIEASRQAERAAALESQLIQNNVSLMLSQIQPHFIANSLTTICAMCDTNPGIVKPSLERFTDYLGDNIEAIWSNSLVPFSRELEHIENYLYLEKMRFEERLTIHMEIAVKSFLIPTLTLQPIVENAVKHGLCERKEGGTLRIRTEESDNSIIIIVSDDGVGFDVDKEPADRDIHIGIQNVRTRLQMLCGGSLSLNSKVGVGTCVTIEIPK